MVDNQPHLHNEGGNWRELATDEQKAASKKLLLEMERFNKALAEASKSWLHIRLQARNGSPYPFVVMNIETRPIATADLHRDELFEV